MRSAPPPPRITGTVKTRRTRMSTRTLHLARIRRDYRPPERVAFLHQTGQDSAMSAARQDILRKMAQTLPAPSGQRPGAGPGIFRLDPTDFGARYEASAKVLWCIAAAIVKDRNAAHDVVQEAAMVALGKLNEFDATTNFSAWAGQIVRFVALNEARRRRRDPVAPTDPGAMLHRPGRQPGSAGGTDSRFNETLQRALDRLEETARACLLMRTVLELSYRHIAEAMAIPEGTAMSHVHRARAAMRAMLSSERAGTGGER